MRAKPFLPSANDTEMEKSSHIIEHANKRETQLLIAELKDHRLPIFFIYLYSTNGGSEPLNLVAHINDGI